MRLTMSVINQDGATNELSSGNWTECGYCLPEWFGASVSFVGDDFFCFSCMGLSKDFLLKKKERMKERKKEIHSFWRYIGILLFDFFTLHFKKDTLLKGSFNMFYNVISTIFHNIHDKLSLLCAQEI